MEYRVLSIDGGGIRGVIPARWLAALQGAPVAEGRHLASLFDLLAGTSTGAILALALACEISPASIVRLYKEKGEAIFPGRKVFWWRPLSRILPRGLWSPKYSADGLEGVLREVFGTRRLGDLKHKVMVLAYDAFTRQPFIMRSWDPYCEDIRVWEAARASSAAPTYFPALVLNIGSIMHPLIDGGVVANNPAACAVAEASRLNGGNLPLRLVSLGTGRAAQPITAKNATEWGAIGWASKILDVLMDDSEMVHFQMAHALQAPHGYFRFHPYLTPEYEAMDDGRPEHVSELDALAESYLHGDGAAVFRETVDALA